MENLFTFLKNLFFLENDSSEFLKTSGKSAYSPVCLHNLVSFYLTPLSSAFEKLCGGHFLPKFLDFYFFSKITLSNLKFWVQWIEQVVDALLHKRLRPFYTKSYGTQICQLFDFSTVF